MIEINLIQRDVMISSSSNQWLELIIAKEDRIWSESEIHGLSFIIPLDVSISIGDSENVSRGYIATKTSLKSVISTNDQAAQLPDITLRFNHCSFVDNLNIVKLGIIMGLWVPHIVEAN